MQSAVHDGPGGYDHDFFTVDFRCVVSVHVDQ